MVPSYDQDTEKVNTSIELTSTKSLSVLVTTGSDMYQDRWRWFLPASRSSLNPPGPSGKAKNLSFNPRKIYRKIQKNFLISLINPFLGGPPRGDGPVNICTSEDQTPKIRARGQTDMT